MSFVDLRAKAKKHRKLVGVEGHKANARLDRRARGGATKDKFNAAIHDQPARPTIDEPGSMNAVHARKRGGHVAKREAGGGMNDAMSGTPARAAVARDADDLGSNYRDENISRPGRAGAAYEPPQPAPRPAPRPVSRAASPTLMPRSAQDIREDGAPTLRPRSAQDIREAGAEASRPPPADLDMDEMIPAAPRPEMTGPGRAMAEQTPVGRVVSMDHYVPSDSNRARARLGLSPYDAIIGGGRKRGGHVKHEDEREDRAMVKRMVKSEALTGRKHGGHLTAAQRHKLPAKDFALSGERYPIEDKNHARNALARVSQHGTSEEKARVRAAVHRKYPEIGKK